MEWLEHNILAYRVVAEILSELREHVRSVLRQRIPNGDYTTGMPRAVLDRLVRTKEDEQAIDWYENEYQELIDFAVFPDFIAIVEHDPEAFGQLTALAPSSALLHTRFLELEVMRAKLGTARPVSEAEMSFLGSFHLRLRRALREGAEVEVSPREKTAEAAPADQPEAGSTGEPVDTPDTAAPVAAAPAEPGDPTETDAELGAADVAPPEPEQPEPGETEAPPTDGEIAPGDDHPAGDETAPDSEADDDAPAAAPDPSQADRPRPPRRAAKTPERKGATPSFDDSSDTTNLRDALENNDSRFILRELYREITVMAEEMWTDSPPTTPVVWDRVRISKWYGDHFTKIGLKPVSDFHEVLAAFNERLAEGISTPEVQDFLKDRNFAQILLSLRDMFQKQNL